MHSRKFMVNFKENLRISDIILEPHPDPFWRPNRLRAYAIWTTWPRGFAASAAACCCREWKSLSTTGSPMQASRQKRTMIPSGSSHNRPTAVTAGTVNRFAIEWWKLELLAKCREIAHIVGEIFHDFPILSSLYPHQTVANPLSKQTTTLPWPSNPSNKGRNWNDINTSKNYDGQVALSTCLKISKKSQWISWINRNYLE